MKHQADVFPLTSLIPSYLCETSQLHAYLEGVTGRSHYGTRVPYQKYQVVPLLTNSRRRENFFQLVPKFQSGTTLKHVPIK